MSAWDNLRWQMGMSANAIAGSGTNHPHDPADLVRCVKYSESRGLTTEALTSRMSAKSVEWSRLMRHWDALVELLKYEVETSTDGFARRTYREMKRIIADGTACTDCDSTGRGTECTKCKGRGRRCSGRCRAENCYAGADFCTSCRGRGYLGGDR